MPVGPPAVSLAARVPLYGACNVTTEARSLQPLNPSVPLSNEALVIRFPGIFLSASALAFDSLRRLDSCVSDAPWLERSFPCCVTVFCNVCSAVESAFLLTFAFVVDRSLFSLVMALLAAVRSFPCCVTVFCSVCTVLASAFLLTSAFVVDSPFSSAVVRLPMLLMVLSCWLTFVVKESTAEAVASAVVCAA